MPIKIAGQVTVNAPREQVWDMIFDVETMKGVIGRIPGITLERLEQTDDVTYEITAVVGVAAVKGKYDGKLVVTEKTAPQFVRLKGEGKGGGNWTSGEVALTLTERDGLTEMTYSGQGNLSGPLASLGQRLVDSVGRQFIDQGARIFAEEIAQRHLARVAPELVPARPVFGLGYQVLVALLVLGAVLALLIALILQSAPR